MFRHLQLSLALAAAFILNNWAALAAESSPSLVGTWEVKSFTALLVDTGETIKNFGEHPIGYLQYTPGGHVVVFEAGDGRKKPAGLVPTDLERAELFKTIISGYAGTYRIEGNKVIHHIAAAWLPSWEGTDQVREFKIDGKTLTIRTAPFKNVNTAKTVVNTLVLERLE